MIIIAGKKGSSRGLVVEMHDLRAVSRGFKSQKTQRWWQEGHPTLIRSCAPTKSPWSKTLRPRTGNIGSIKKAKKLSLVKKVNKS